MSTQAQTQQTQKTAVPMEIVTKHWIEIVAWAAFGFFWFSTFKFFWLAWGNPDGYYSHGYLIPFMCAATAYYRYQQHPDLPAKPSWMALVPLLIVLFAAMIAGMQNSQTMRGLLFPVSVAFFVAALYGWNYLKTYFFSVFYLYFMCPIPEFLLTTVAFRIQMLSTQVATLMSKYMFFIDAYRVETGIQTSNVNVEVGEACSGFRMLVAITAFAVFLVYAVKGDLWRKVLFVLISMPLAVIVNSLRVALLVVVGHYWDPNLVPTLHDYSGYVVLIVAFALMYGIARLIGCREFRLTESS